MSVFIALPSILAHMTFRGGDEVVGGALHPFTTPSHVLVLLALGLLLGQRVPLELKRPWVSFAIASALALAYSATGRIAGVHPAVLMALALLISALVGLAWKLPRVTYLILCSMAAIGIGLDSGPESTSAFATIKALFGTWAAMNLFFGYVALCASNGSEKPWARIAIRIAGSWIVAISLLMIAFSLRK